MPEILFINEMLCKVSLLRNLPASITFKISAAILTARQTEKVSSRSLKVNLEKAEAVPSQKRKILGLRVFKKKPLEKILTISRLRNLRALPSASVRRVTFL